MDGTRKTLPAHQVPAGVPAGRKDEDTMTKPQLERLAEFRYQLRKFLRFSEETTQAHGLTPLQYQLLLQIKGFPGRSHATIGELAEKLQARHHGVVALISRTEDAGLVQRRPSMRDLRQVEVLLTAAGETVLHELAALHTHELASRASLFGRVPGPQAGARRAKEAVR